MKSRQRAIRKGDRRNDHDRALERKPRRLLSVRSALVLQLAVLAALGGSGLLFLAQRSPVQTALGGIAIFAFALRFFDGIIDR